MNIRPAKFAGTLVLALFLQFSAAGQDAPLRPEASDFILPEKGDWERLREGALQAEAFRLELIGSGNESSNYARSLINRILAFQHICGSALESNRPAIEHFKLTEASLLRSLKSTSNIESLGSGFSEFQGKWFGSWDSFDVDHNWSPILRPEPRWKIREELFGIDINEIQYAWIGDGFGWNLVVSPTDKPKTQVILGVVYHSSVEEPRNISVFRPHVGVRPGLNQLIWITRGEVFFEEVRPGRQDYVITGFYYSRDAHDEITFRGDGFQTIYSRDPSQRAPFHQFQID